VCSACPSTIDLLPPDGLAVVIRFHAVGDMAGAPVTVVMESTDL
jgi:hypothetical protein